MGKRYSRYLAAISIFMIIVICVINGCVYQLTVSSSLGAENPVGTNVSGVALMAILTVLACALGVMTLVLPKNNIILKETIVKLHKKNAVMRENESLLRKQVTALQNEYSMMERTCRAKSKFLNRMSHDIRTPMNAIMGYSTLLGQVADEPDKVNHYAKRIGLSGQTLLELINDVLDMSCIESGNVRLVNHEFNIITALDEAAAAVKPQTEAKGQQFNFYITNSSEREWIIGDKQRLCQVLRNLLSNATKYTPEGGNVDLIVNIIEVGSDQLQMLCQIKDTGCGMSSEFINRMFLPFEREDNEQNTTATGTGLGMSIAKSFVELMNGEISVESKLDVGTLVTIRIPLTPVAREDKSIRQRFDNDRIMEGLNFLVAEDNDSNAEILMEVLTALGAGSVLAKNGQEAVEIFEASAADEFDMVLMDIQMPIMNGYQATAAIRRSKHPMAKEIVILAMTADAFEEDVQRAFVSGMNGHVAKPLDLNAFIGTVRALVKQ